MALHAGVAATVGGGASSGGQGTEGLAVVGGVCAGGGGGTSWRWNSGGRGGRARLLPGHVWTKVAAGAGATVPCRRGAVPAATGDEEEKVEGGEAKGG